MAGNGDLLAQLTALVGSHNVLTGADAAPFLIDWRGRYAGDARCVVRPGTTAEVAAVVGACATAGVPIVPQGGNTSLCGAATPDVSGQAVVLSLLRLNRIRALDADNNTVTVEAGCTLAAVQAAAQAAGRLFPLSLAAEGSCSIGGNLSTNAGGVQVLRYGNTRELTLGLEAVLPDGQVWDGLRALRKDNTGYDLKHLFIGAEGTLGVITAAVLKLFPLPCARVTAWLAIRSPAVAVKLLGLARQALGDRLTAYELIARPALDLVLQHFPACSDPLATQSPWYLLVEWQDGGDESSLRAVCENFLADAIGEGWVDDAVLASSLDQARRLWALRENISEAQKIEGLSIKHDVAVPVSRLPEFLEAADAALKAAYPDVRIVAFGHAGDGNLHYNLSQPVAGDNAAFIAATPQVNLIVHDLVRSLGGSISAEHGLGQLKREEIRRYKSPVEMQLMAAIKAALDPQGLMNPGKVL